MTPLELWLRDEQPYHDIPRRLRTADGWELSVHWTQRAFYAQRAGKPSLMLPFESVAACVYDGVTPKGPGRREKKPKPGGP